MTERVDWQFAVKVPGMKDGWLCHKGLELMVGHEPEVFDDLGEAEKGLRLLQDAHHRLGLTCQAEVVARKVTTTIGEWETHEDVG
jgi:hypothetical protein